MVKLQNLRIFDKNGYVVDWTPSSNFTIKISSKKGYDAVIYPTADINSKLDGCVIISPGYYYGEYVHVTGEEVLKNYINKVELFYKDILLDDITNKITIKFKKSESFISGNVIKDAVIEDIIFNDDIFLSNYINNYSYPIITYTSTLYFKEVSVGLHESQSLFIFNEESENNESKLTNVYDNIDSSFVFSVTSEMDTMKLFRIKDDMETISFELSQEVLLPDFKDSISPNPIPLNISFNAKDEGVYEGSLDIYYKSNDKLFLFGQILLIGTAEGEDERYRTLMSNNGLPDPINIYNLFKESNINEDNIDYTLINEKSKYLFLEYKNIFPYIGTYKALINAVKWLGYDDVYFREWFLNCKLDKEFSYKLSYDAKERTDTLLNFSIDERNNLKKLNKLSLVYCINRTTGEIDQKYGTPITENCYSYTLDEMRMKLYSLKEWLETNIIGVNCRISDITGEAVYFERFDNIVYSTFDKAIDYKKEITITPVTQYLVDNFKHIAVSSNDYVEETLIDGTAKLKLNIKELAINGNKLTADTFTMSMKDIIEQKLSATALHPFPEVKELQWKASIDTRSAIIGEKYVSKSLFIYNNTIRFHDLTVNESIFKCDEGNIIILLEEANLRNINLSWNDNLKYKIAKEEDSYTLYEDINGELVFIENAHSYIKIETSKSTILKYYYNDFYKCPILSISNFILSLDTLNGKYSLDIEDEIILDILDGKICFYKQTAEESYINFNYDTDLNEQEISANFIYLSNRLPISDFGNDKFYEMPVNYIGNYNIELYVWDIYNTLYYSKLKKQYSVVSEYINFDVLYEDEFGNITGSDIENIYNENKFPIIDKIQTYKDFNIMNDYTSDIMLNVPSISYFTKLPEKNSYVLLSNYEFNLETLFSKKIKSVPTFTYNINKVVKQNNLFNTLECVNESNILKGDVIKINITLKSKENNTEKIESENSSSVRVLDTYTENNKKYIVIRGDIPFWVMDENGNVLKYEAQGKSSLNGYFDENKEYEFIINVTPAWETNTQMYLKLEHAIEDKNIFNLRPYKYNNLNYIDRNFEIKFLPFNLKTLYKNWGISPFTYSKLNDNNIKLEKDSFVIFKSNNTSLNHIWTVLNRNSNETILRVFNDNVCIKLFMEGVYDVILESYDVLGNTIITKKEGIITIQ